MMSAPPGPITMPMDKVQEKMASMSPEQLAAFMQFMKEDQENPANPETLFVVPQRTDMTKEWKEFFRKILEYCGASYEGSASGDPTKKMELIAWEKRRWLMDDKGLDEYDMLYNAGLVKEKGNTQFKAGKTQEALNTYVSAMRVFPLPDSMNNIAAAALKLYRYQLAIQYATASLELGLMENPQSKSKALYRRAQAHKYLGEFREALSDIEAALNIRSEDQDFLAYKAQLVSLQQSRKSTEDLHRYLAKQPKELKDSTQDQRHSTAGFTGLDLVNAPASFKEAGLPPVF